jgi:hypothetical protein
MTTALTDHPPVATQPFDTPDFTRLPQTPDTAHGPSIWTQLHSDFLRMARTRRAATEYAAVELAAELRDNPTALGAVVQLYQSGSQLASAVLVEAFRGALITFTRYARIDACEQLDRQAVRAQTVLATFFEVASTTDPQSPSITGRLYGETLRRVTRQRPEVEQYPAQMTDAPKRHAADAFEVDFRSFQSIDRRDEDTRRDTSRYVEDCHTYSPTHIDVVPAATRPGLNWDRIERTGLARDVLATARDNGVITAGEHDILAARFLSDGLVPVATVARQCDVSLSACETKLRRGLQKLTKFYAAAGVEAQPTVA